jgi:hypothetical protein
MKNPEILIKDIQKLKKDLDSQEVKLPPGVAGMYGEILVVKKLQQVVTKSKSKFEVGYYSGQKGADIQLKNGHNILNIEVKTSRLKNEGFGMWYGVALNIKKCKKHNKVYIHPKKAEIEGDFCYFDYVVFVALANDLLKAKYYVIPRSFIEKYEKLLRNDHKRFTSATHRIIVSDGTQMPDMSPEQKRLIRATEVFQDKWSQLNLN